MPAEDPPVTDPWAGLREATRARIGLTRVGDTMALRHVLEFQLAHAQARDAVHAVLDTARLAAELAPLEVVHVRSQAPDRATYLRRPDLGRVLDAGSAALLTRGAYDVVFVLADGLSATATHRQAVPLLRACLERLAGWSIAPVVLASQARVALGDGIGARLGARMTAMLIGERPGLSVAESLGVYLTFDPRTGRRDSERNCVSNIHGFGGLGHAAAADTVVWLLREALRLQLTGVGLKEDAPQVAAVEALSPSRPQMR